MRQAGVLAAAAKYALRKNRDRLVRDHENARRIADILGGVPGAVLDQASVDTNIVVVRTPHALSIDVVAAAKKRGVLVSAFGRNTIRLVTHMDVEDTAVRGGEIVAEVIAKLDAKKTGC